MKKWLSVLLVIVLLFGFAVFALGSGSESETADQGSGSADASADDNNSLGDYTVDIKSCRLAKDFENDPVVIVTYTFTNVSGSEPASFSFAFEEHVYQDGVGLNEAYILADSANYSSDNQLKEIKAGASLDVEAAYELNDTTTDIEVEVSELFSFDDKKIKKTFTIA